MISVFKKRTSLTFLAFVILGFLVYSNTFNVPFHFDDSHVITNLSLEDMLERCKGGGSRVIPHFTFLLNYWMGVTDVLGYHIFNTLIHIGTAYFVYIFLFQILLVSDPNEIYASSQHTDSILPPLSDPIFWPALLGGILFLVHPLATQSVTYITQRYASLAGFFYIGSLALFVSARVKFEGGERFFTGSHLLRYLPSFTMAVLAMRTKEMAITLPAAVLLTEYYFIQSDFKAISKRILYLLPLLSTGLIIPVSDMIGVETISLESVAALQEYTWGEGISRNAYLFTQFKIIAGVYFKLMLWPIGQNIDHYYVVSKTLFDLPTLASLVTICVILGAGLWLFRRARLVSFGILWFFVTISPTSSIVPNIQFVAEQRAYISLMGLAFAIAGLPLWQSHWKRYLSVLLPIILLLSGLTYARNRVWQSDLSLWEDSVEKSSEKPKPHYNLGVALSKRNRLEEAIDHYSKALSINPNITNAHNNLGAALAKQGKLDEAINHYTQTLRINPSHANAHNNLGVALSDRGELKEAMKHYLEALRIDPDFADAHYNLGLAYNDQNKLEKAMKHYSEALRKKPVFAEANYSLGLALATQGRLKEAVSHYSEALRIKPDFTEAHYNLGLALYNQGIFNKSIRHYKEALRIKPDFAEAHYNLGLALAGQGQGEEAIRHLKEALRIKPDYTEAHNNMGVVLTQQGAVKEAVGHFQQALRTKPDFVEAHNNLGVVLMRLGRLKEALAHYSEALRINPDFADARRNKELVLKQMGKSAGASDNRELGIEELRD